jgi:hypothetical protein
MHRGRIVPEEERLIRFACVSIHAIARSVILVDRLHALLVSGLADDRLATLAVRLAMEHAATELLRMRIFGVVGQFRFLLGIQVIEI